LPSTSATKSDDHNYVLPTLTAEEQMDVDNPNDQHRLLTAGARVLALCGTDYYAAYVCGYFSYCNCFISYSIRCDVLGRYYVLFVEDNLKRIIPPAGVIPVSLLIPGSIVCPSQLIRRFYS
jgi:hypothetical protein